ncbi:MAG: RnfABCDGE type electron transport complex subunit B [Bacteroidales bacterium]
MILSAVISLGAIGGAAAVILFFVAQKFKVIEDPRIDEVEELLPGANCGGCGFAGCRAFAEALVKSQHLDDLYCPVGGNELNKEVAPILGVEAKEKEPEIAVVRCSGSRAHAPKKVEYEGPQSCAFANSLFAGESGCPNGCLGLGDCEFSCDFDAIHINEETGLPEVLEEECVACGACIDACPRDIIELRPKGKKSRRVYVSCINIEKGGPAKKNCEVACIGCGKCVKECPFDAITLENNLAYIDPVKCKLCRKCVPVCPTGAIIETNFPPRKAKAAKTKKEVGPDKASAKPKIGNTAAVEQDPEQKNTVEKEQPLSKEKSEPAVKKEEPKKEKKPEAKQEQPQKDKKQEQDSPDDKNADENKPKPGEDNRRPDNPENK